MLSNSSVPEINPTFSLNDGLPLYLGLYPIPDSS